MYHYIRFPESKLPHFQYLHVDNFERQLDWFEKNHGFTPQDHFLSCLNEKGNQIPKGVILTFDDGFSEHYEIVFPILKKRNLWGIFYVPTKPYEKNKILDVHRIHLLLGKFNAVKIIECLKSILTADMLLKKDIQRFNKLIYLRQNNDQARETFKRIMNYFISYQHREMVLDKLESLLKTDKLSSHYFYMNTDQLLEMHKANMIIGSHSHTHLLFSKLSKETQDHEIQTSCSFLEKVIGEPIKTFCYPYGGFHSFTSETEQILTKYSILFSVNVEPRDVHNNDILNRPQALPRYDCNLFPFGRINNANGFSI